MASEVPHAAATVVVVDPFSSGALIAPRLRREGFRVAAVVSPDAPEVFLRSFVPGDHDAVVDGRQFAGPGAADALIGQVAALAPMRVLAGAESGVELADHLASRLTPGRANDPARAAARRDKGRMAEALVAAGLDAPRQVAAGSPGAVAAWLAETGLRRRALVLKPPKGCGGDSVIRLPAGADWRPVFDRLIGSRNRMRQVNDRVIVQERLGGPEFILDTVSTAGRHALVSASRARKRPGPGGTVLYESIEPVSPGRAPVPELARYVAAVLDALGVREGPAHSEVILTRRGPVLVETGARMHGGGFPTLARLCAGDGQLDRLAALCRECPDLSAPRPLRREGAIVFLQDRDGADGIAPATLDAIRALPSFFALETTAAEDAAGPAVDLFSMAGHVILIGRQPGDVARDRRRLRALLRQPR